MSDDKDGLKSMNVYKFDNTKESGHEFALKFRVIADSRGYAEKSDQIAMIPKWIKVLFSKYGVEVKRIKLGNSDENRSLQRECDKQNLGVIFEFTAPGTPQQNSVVERKYQHYWGKPEL